MRSLRREYGLTGKLAILVTIEIYLIFGSLVFLAVFESLNSSIGNSINVAGKNGLLASTVLLESEHYISNQAEKSQVAAALDNLETNILLLKSGGEEADISLPALPAEFNPDWQLVYENWLSFETHTRMVVLADLKPETTDSLLEQKHLGERLVASSDALVRGLAEYSKRTSDEVVALQIGLAVLNVGVHIVLLHFVFRIHKPIKLLSGAIRDIGAGKPSTTITREGNDEVWQLVESFNSMTRSIREASHKLAMERQKYYDLFDGAPDLYRMVDRRGIILDCNEAYVKSLGYSDKKELVGKSIFENTAEISIDSMRQGFETWKKTGIVRDSEVWLKRKDGTTFPALISATAACIYHENREIVASNTCIIDATKIYEAKRKLEDANKRLVELDAMKTEFIFTASHELRTPIQPILNFAELAERGNIKPDLALAQIKKEARRLQQLTNDILDVARIEGGNLALSLEEFSLNDLVRELFDASATSISLVPIKLSLASHEDSMVISADRQRMIQVLSNIVGNAAKFTKSGHIEISTSSVYDGRYLEICVSDTGAGIPPEILPSLFLKFATKSVAKGAEHGTGLGLYIARAIVVGHGGKIIGYNNSEAGATFKIWLPGPKVARTSVSIAE